MASNDVGASSAMLLWPEAVCSGVDLVCVMMSPASSGTVLGRPVSSGYLSFVVGDSDRVAPTMILSKKSSLFNLITYWTRLMWK